MSAEVVRDTDPVRIRLARPEDDAALLALDLVSWPPGTAFPSLRDAKRDRFFDDRAAPDDHVVAEDDGVIVGYVRVVRANRVPEGAHVYGIYGLTVAEHARGRGIASALLREAEHLARSRGARKLVLRVFSSNPRAQRLYERHGFTVEGRFREEFFIDGEYVDDIAMAKRLV